MKNISGKRKKRKYLIFKLSILALVLMICFQIVSLQCQLYQKKVDISSLQQQLTQQKQVNENLEKTLDSGNSNENIEKIAREKLGYVYPFERVYTDVTQN